MSREMKNVESGQVVKVYEHILTRNAWEYYVLEPSEGKDVVFALVLGFENEMGDVSLREMKGHIVSRTADLSDLMPADGYVWA